MPISVSMTKDTNFLHMKFEGETNMTEVVEELERLFQLPEYKPGMRSLIDLRDMPSFANANDIRRISQFLSDHTEKLGYSRTALVATNPLVVGMANMFLVFVDRSPFRVEVFKTQEEAIEWLDVDPDLVVD